MIQTFARLSIVTLSLSLHLSSVFGFVSIRPLHGMSSGFGYFCILPSPGRISNSLLMVQSTSCDDLSCETATRRLENFDRDFLRRIKAGKLEGRSASEVEFARAQSLGVEELQKERKELREACRMLAESAEIVTLGIMAETGERGLTTLKQWVTGLEISRGVLRAVDEAGAEVPPDTYNGQPVYIKYSSKTGGDAYMKPYGGGNRGVLFQPMLKDGEFRQYGDLPLATFAVPP